MSHSISDVAQLYRNQGREVPVEFADAPALKKRLEKYGRIKKQVEDIVFDSTLEAEAFMVLRLWYAAGLMRGFGLQPAFVLHEGFRDASGKWHRAVKYIADFSFTRPTDDREVVIDVKGIKTPAFRIKEKMFRAKFPDIDLQIWDRAKVKELSRC